MGKRKDIITEEISLEVRDQLIDRIEVLDKVKHLFLIPGVDLTTVQGVADFYEVDPVNIRTNILTRHRAELESDGLCKIKKKDFITEHSDAGMSFIDYGTYLKINVEDNYYLNLSNNDNILFPRRAILRVGMLLKDSHIAREVRNQLLNIEEVTAKEDKISSINTEQELLYKALSSSLDVAKFIEAVKDHESFKNRHIEEAYELLKEDYYNLKTIADNLSIEVDELTYTNKLLTGQFSKVAPISTYRRIVTTMMSRIAKAKRYSSTYLCYQELYTIIRDNYNINLSNRKYMTNNDLSKIDFIEGIEEWIIVIQVAAAMSCKYGVEIYDLLKELETKGFEN